MVKWILWACGIALIVTLILVLLLGHFIGHWFDNGNNGGGGKSNGSKAANSSKKSNISQGPGISVKPIDEPIFASTTDFGFGAQTACGCNGDAVVKQLEGMGWAGMATPVWMGTPYLNSIPTPVVKGGDSCSASELVDQDEPRNCSIGSGGCASCWKLTPTGDPNIYGVTPEASEIGSVYGVVLDGCEASNSYGNNTQWCVPYKGIPKGGIDLSGEDCPGKCCSDDANPILKSKYDAEQVFGTWTQSDKLFNWNAPECYDSDGNWICTNVAGYGYHFDFATQDLGDKAPWKPGTNPIVKAEKIECPDEVTDILRSKCGKNSETSGPFDCDSYCNGNRPEWWGGCNPVCPDDEGCVGCTGDYPSSKYIKVWDECTPPQDKECCPGSECVGDDNYSQCKLAQL